MSSDAGNANSLPSTYISTVLTVGDGLVARQAGVNITDEESSSALQAESASHIILSAINTIWNTLRADCACLNSSKIVLGVADQAGGG